MFERVSGHSGRFFLSVLGACLISSAQISLGFDLIAPQPPLQIVDSNKVVISFFCFFFVAARVFPFRFVFFSPLGSLFVCFSSEARIALDNQETIPKYDKLDQKKKAKMG